MTVGEKIQKYRREKGLSQEELGQKLYVSRQTVSLWEMDKTLPTVDNLIRLKEIFGVSLDDILLEEDKDAKEACDSKAPDTVERVPESIPSEIYRFEFSSGEIKETVLINVKNLLSRAIFHILLIAAFFIFCACLEKPNYSLAVAVTAVVAVRYAVAIRQFIAIRKRTYQRMGSQIYEYSIFENYFEANIMNKVGETLYRRKCFFDEMGKVHEAKSYFLISIDGARDECFIFRKCDLKENSFIHAYQRKYPARVKRLPFQDTLKSLFYTGALLTGAALAATSFLLATSLPYDVYRGQLWWLYLLFALFPIFCTVIGILQKKRNGGGLLKIIIPVILALCLITVGVLALHYGYPNSDFEKELMTLASRDHENPELLYVFELVNNGELVDYICIFKTDNYNFVVGTLYFNNKWNKVLYIVEMAEGMLNDFNYGYITLDREYYVYSRLLNEVDTDCHTYKEVTDNGRVKYICFYLEPLYS